jgi:CHASE2 domain-containing sensor protein
MGQAVLSFLIVFTIVWLPLIASIAIVVGISLWVARRLGWRRPDRMPPVPPVAPPSSAEA